MNCHFCGKVPFLTDFENEFLISNIIQIIFDRLIFDFSWLTDRKMVVRPSSGPTIGQADIEQAISEPFIYVSDYTKKKIRNLEKRKAKLESYKAKLKSGEPISKDQQTAGMSFL